MPAAKRRAPSKKAAAVPPGSGLRHLTGDSEYERLAREQRTYFRDLADRVERGEILNARERRRAADAIRLMADQIPEKQERQRGQAPQVDYSAIAVCFVEKRNRDVKVNTAIDELAGEFEVSTTTVKNALKRYEAEARRVMGGKHFAD